MKYSELLNNQIDRGQKGLNVGIPYSIERLNKYTYGTQRGRYYLYFALPGVGKSSIVYDQHIFSTYDYMLKHQSSIDLEIHIWSLEISPAIIIGKAAIRWLFTRHNILVDYNHLISAGKSKVSSRVIELLRTPEWYEYIDGLNKILHIYTKASAASIIKICNAVASTRGTAKIEEGLITSYTPKKENEMVILIIDHISLAKAKNKKESIDEISEYFFQTRNVTGYTPIVVQQVNPTKDTYKKSNELVLPDHEDLRDSKNTFQDADYAISIGNPYKHGVDEYLGYQIIPSERNNFIALEDRFRILQLTKNRWGSISENIPTLYIGEIGHFTDIKDSFGQNKVSYTEIKTMIQQRKVV